jgi:hypothetical protein
MMIDRGSERLPLSGHRAKGEAPTVGQLQCATRTAGSDRDGGTEIGLDRQAFVPVANHLVGDLVRRRGDADWQTRGDGAAEHVGAAWHRSFAGGRCRRWGLSRGQQVIWSACDDRIASHGNRGPHRRRSNEYRANQDRGQQPDQPTRHAHGVGSLAVALQDTILPTAIRSVDNFALRIFIVAAIPFILAADKTANNGSGRHHHHEGTVLPEYRETAVSAAAREFNDHRRQTHCERRSVRQLDIGTAQ